MNIKLKRLVLGMASVGALGLYGCGGGGSSAVDSGNPVAPVIAATVDVHITVIDGPIQNAQVCPGEGMGRQGRQVVAEMID